MNQVKEDVAKLLISIGCVSVSPKNPFKYASGLKGPIYCDNRRLLSHVEERKRVTDYFVNAIEASRIEFDIIAGMATGGIPHAAWIADRLSMPMVYVRSKPKGHGQHNQVEGGYKDGARVVLIEDLVNQGKSLGEGIEGVKNAGLEVAGVFSIVDYEMVNSKRVLHDHLLDLHSLTDFSSIVQVAMDQGTIDARGKDILQTWQTDPSSWE